MTVTFPHSSTNSVVEARRAHNEKLALKADQTRATWFPLALLTILIALPLLQFAGNFNYLLHLVLFAASFVAMASGWNIIGGFAGYISLGHSVFFGIGGYVAGMLLARYGISTIVTAPWLVSSQRRSVISSGSSHCGYADRASLSPRSHC